MQREASTPLPRLAGSTTRGGSGLLPRIHSAPILPGTPPALSHYVDLTPVRVPQRRMSRTVTIRAPAEEDLERVRQDLEARERQEAEHWGYGRKVRPGSRMGLDGRKMPARPPWAQSPNVTYALGELEKHPLPADSLRRSGVLARLGSTQREQSSLRGNNYGRVVPYQLVRNAPLLEGFTTDDIPVPHGKTERGCVTICEFTQAEGLLHDVLRVRRCDVLMGNQIPCYPEKLGPLLPGLRLCLLQGTAIGDRTGPIAEALLEATRLTHLTLSENQMGNDGVEKLAQTLANTTLISLNLSHNKIANHGASALAVPLTKCPCYAVMSKAIQEGQAAVVEAVLMHGFPVNPVFPADEPLLLRAARAGSASICECLLDRNADIEARDGRGETAVMIAAANGHKRAMTLLVDRGADMNKLNCDGLSALMLAARHGHLECLQVLIGIARLLPQRLGVYIRGIRDLEVYTISGLERLSSGGSVHSQGSSKKASAWGKVRGATFLGAFGRSKGSSGFFGRTSSFASNSGKTNTNGGIEDSDGIQDGSDPSSAPTSKRWGPGLLSRVRSMGSSRGAFFLRRSSSAGQSMQSVHGTAEEIAAKERAEELHARASEQTFGRIPSTNTDVSGTQFGNPHAMRTRLQAQPLCISGSQFGHVDDAVLQQPSATGRGIARLPSVSENVAEHSQDSEPLDTAVPAASQCSSRPSSQGSTRPTSRDSVRSAASRAPSHKLGRRPSLFSVHGPEGPDTPNDAPSVPASQQSRMGAALAKAPVLRSRPSMKMWSSGETDLLQKALPQTESGAKDGADTTVEEIEKLEGALVQFPLLDRSRAKKNLATIVADSTPSAEESKASDTPAPLERAGALKLFSRLGSFGKRPGSKDSVRGGLTQVDADRTHDTVYVRLSVGREARRQEYISPPQEVPCKTGTLQTLVMHQFSNVTAGTNDRLKLELLFKDPAQSDADAKSIGLCVQDLDVLLDGESQIVDSWCVLHDFTTRRKVGALKCTLRSMPEQFYETCRAGDNVLVHAARNGRANCVRLLLDAGIAVNFPTIDGNTPLIVAAKEGQRETVELLLRHGADTTIKNRGGLNAIDVAEKFERGEIIRILKGIRMQKEQLPFNLDSWPSDHDQKDPAAFLKDRFRGKHRDSQLVVQVVKARHLPRADAYGLSDPFVKMNLNGMKYTTKVVKNSLQPSWDETFSFDDQSLGVWVGQDMTFEIYDWDVVGDSDLMGSFKVDIASMARSQPQDSEQMGQMWFTLRDENDKIVFGQHDPEKLKAGELQESEVLLRYRFTPAMGRFLEMGLLEARNLPSKLPQRGKRELLPSAFATVSVAGISYRTEPMKKAADPKWHSSYRFIAKSMDPWMFLEIHELALARKKTIGIGTMLDPGEHSLIGKAKVPFHKLFSLSNVNLKDIWIELVDADGMKLKNSEGLTSALRIGINFMVLGEDESTWGGVDYSSLQLERHTKLNPDVVGSLMKLIDHPSLKHAQASSAYERLTKGFEAKIPVEGMVEAAQELAVDFSSDVLMLRMLMNTKNYDYVIDFAEFCKVLNILQDGEDLDDIGLEMPVLGKETESAARSGSPTGPTMQEETPQTLIDKDVEPAVMMRVVLSKEALSRRPDLLEHSGDGAGTIVFVDCKGKLSKTCSVVWDKTGVKKDYITGFAGDDILALFEPPKSKDVKDKMLQEVVIQRDVPARVGMRVVVRKVALSLNPTLAKQSRGRTGTITWIEPSSAEEGVEHGSRVEVVWDGSFKKILVSTGLNGDFHLALHEVLSSITTADIALLGTPHSMSFMQTLNLDHNHIGDSGATALAESLKGNWMLKRLSIKHNRIARDGGNAIGLALQENTVLEELYLNLNQLSDDGIVHLCRSLGTNVSPLKLLDLEGNQLSYVASRLLAHALASAKNLHSLLLSNNLLGGDGAGLLEQGLRLSSSVTCLDLERNVLGDIGMRCIMRAMRRIPPRRGRKAQPDNRSLLKLNVSTNNITDACIEDVEEALQKNITLRTIIANDNEISEQGRMKIEKLLAANVRRADLEKSAIKIQCLFRGRLERLARAKEGGVPVQAQAARAPKEGDLVQLDQLQGNLQRYNGKRGRVISIDFDAEHRQWVTVQLENRTLPIRCQKKSVTVRQDEQREPSSEDTENLDEPVREGVSSTSQTLKILDDEPEVSQQCEESALAAIPDDTPRSGASGVSKVSGMSDLVRESSELLAKLPEQQREDLVSHVLHAEGLVASALLRKLALQDWPDLPEQHPSTAGGEEIQGAREEIERPKTYGGKSVKERDLLMTAAKLTVLNMGDALMQQQAAAEEMAREAGRKCMEAAEHYAELEAHLKAVIVDEDTSEEDVKIALQALTDAENEAVRMMQEADEAEYAARRAFRAMSDFKRFEREETELEKAISGLDAGGDSDSDFGNQLTDRRSVSGEDKVDTDEHKSVGSQSVKSHESAARSNKTAITHGQTSKRATGNAESALEQTAAAGASVSAFYKRLQETLEDQEANAERVEAAVAEFNRTQDAALVAFDSAIKALEDEAASFQVYHEDSETFVNTMRQEMADAFARLQALQDSDGAEEEFAEALSDFSNKNAQIAQLVVRAEIFRLGSSWSESSTYREAHSPGRHQVVEHEVHRRLSGLLENARSETARIFREQAKETDSVEEDYYTSKEEAAALLIQTIARGNAVRWKSKGLGNKTSITAGLQALFEKKYSDEEMDAIVKIQGLARGGRDRRLIRRNKRLGRVAVTQDYLNFLKSQTPEALQTLGKQAVKIQARFRGAKTRTALQRSKKGVSDAGIERAADIFESVTGADMTSDDAEARYNRQQLAERLAMNKKSVDAAYNEDTAEQELAAVIIQRRVRGMQTRAHMTHLTAENTEKEEHALRSMMDNAGTMMYEFNKTKQLGEDEAALRIQKRVRGMNVRAKKGGFFSGLKQVGNSIAGAFTSSDSPTQHEVSNHVQMLKATKTSLSLQTDDSVRKRSQGMREVRGAEAMLERGLDAALDPVVKMSEEDKLANEAEKEAAALLGGIRAQALAEMEEDLADAAGLLQNLDYEGKDEELDSDDSPVQSPAGTGVSFFNLKEFKMMQARRVFADALIGDSHTQVVLKIFGHDLANLDGAWGKSDPYLVFSRFNDDGSRVEIARTPVIQDDLNPKWPPIHISLKALCDNDQSALFRIECWDSDASLADPLSFNHDDLIGFIDTTVDQLLKQWKERIPLLPPTPEYLEASIARQLVSQGVDKASAMTQAAAAATAKAVDFMTLGAGVKAGGAAAAGLKKGMWVGLHGASKLQDLGAGAISEVGGLGAAGMSKVGKLGAGAMAKGMQGANLLKGIGTGAISGVSNLAGVSQVGKLGAEAMAKGMQGANLLKGIGTGAISTVGQLAKDMTGRERLSEGTDFGPGFISVQKISVKTRGNAVEEVASDPDPSSTPSSRQPSRQVNRSKSTKRDTHQAVQPLQRAPSADMSAEEAVSKFFAKKRTDAGTTLEVKRPGGDAIGIREKARFQSPLSKVGFRSPTTAISPGLPSSLRKHEGPIDPYKGEFWDSEPLQRVESDPEETSTVAREVVENQDATPPPFVPPPLKNSKK